MLNIQFKITEFKSFTGLCFCFFIKAIKGRYVCIFLLWLIFFNSLFDIKTGSAAPAFTAFYRLKPCNIGW